MIQIGLVVFIKEFGLIGVYKEAVQFGLENYTIIIVKIVTLPILVLNDANFG